MKTFRYIHCGDLHLGCKPGKIEDRFEDFFKAFSFLVDYSINNKVNYILISGDMFHLKVINSKTLLKTTTILEKAKLANIKVFVIEGNHDKAFYVDEDSWLDYLHQKKYITLLGHHLDSGNIILNNETIYEDDNIRIIGLSYMGGATSRYLKGLEETIQKSSLYTIMMLHAGINHWCGEDMGDISLNDILPLKSVIDYIALGHIHVRYEYQDFCYNAGLLENIRFKDAKKNKDKGFYDVTVIDNQKTVNFIKYEPRPISLINIDVISSSFPKTVEKQILQYPYDIKKDSILEITLSGQVSFNPYLIDISMIRQNLLEKYNLVQLEINNYINILSESSQINEVIDRKVIEKSIILNTLKKEYPEHENLEEISENIMTLKQQVLEDNDFENIINSLMNMENIL